MIKEDVWLRAIGEYLPYHNDTCNHHKALLLLLRRSFQ